MRKSNWIIAAVLVLASAFLLWLWYRLGFNKIDNPLDLVLSIAWWAVLVIVAVVIARLEARRRRAIRTVYVSQDKLFNNELGFVECGDPSERAAVIERMLSELKYGFKYAEMPAKDQNVKFDYVVRSDVFKKKSARDANPGQAAASGAGATSTTGAPNEQKPEYWWEGEVVCIIEGAQNVTREFDGREALKALVAKA